MHSIQFLRYDLSFTQYFKQALFLSLCSLIETVAIILGIYCRDGCLYLFPNFDNRGFCAFILFAIKLVLFAIND